MRYLIILLLLVGCKDEPIDVVNNTRECGSIVFIDYGDSTFRLRTIIVEIFKFISLLKIFLGFKAFIIRG